MTQCAKCWRDAVRGELCERHRRLKELHSRGLGGAREEDRDDDWPKPVALMPLAPPAGFRLQVLLEVQEAWSGSRTSAHFTEWLARQVQKSKP